MPVTLINVNFIILWYRFVSVCLFGFFFVLCCSTVCHVILIKLINLPIFDYYYFFLLHSRYFPFYLSCVTTL